MKENRRRHKRYDTEVQIYFHVAYDLKTKVEFRVLSEDSAPSQKYSATSKNVSAAGLCFTSDKSLEEGDILCLEVYLPGSKEPIVMDGEVRWSAEVPGKSKKVIFDTGVKLVKVNGESVDDSIHYDNRYDVEWSVVLESVLGNYRVSAQKRKKKD